MHGVPASFFATKVRPESMAVAGEGLIFERTKRPGGAPSRKQPEGAAGLDLHHHRCIPASLGRTHHGPAPHRGRPVQKLYDGRGV